jgi:hypothetical protein
MKETEQSVMCLVQPACLFATQACSSNCFFANLSPSLFPLPLHYPKPFGMNEIYEKLQALYGRIPRRHTADNVKEIYSILDEYEDVLKEMEADESYGANTAPLFAPLDSIRATVKNSNSPRASKKEKDNLFDEASGALKDEIEAAMKL